MAKSTLEQVLGGHPPYGGVVRNDGRQVENSLSGDSVNDGGQARLKQGPVFPGVRRDDTVGAAVAHPGRYVLSPVRRHMRVENPGAVQARVLGDAVQEPADVGPRGGKQQYDFANS